MFCLTPPLSFPLSDTGRKSAEEYNPDVTSIIAQCRKHSKHYCGRAKIYSLGYRKKQRPPKCAGDRAEVSVITSDTSVGSEGSEEKN